MAVTRVCYCNRDNAQRAIDFADTPISFIQLDRALESAAETIEGELKREFYPIDETRKFDWPQRNYPPWQVPSRDEDIIALTQVQSPPGTTIPLGSVLLYPPNRKPGWPYTKAELDRSSTAAFQGGSTPQLSVWLTGTFGFTNDQVAAGTLAAQISSTSATTCTVSDGSQAGPGDLLLIDSERLVIADKAAAATGLTQSGAGCTTASSSDNTLATTGSGTLNLGEVLLLDSERMLITDITAAGAAVVKRAWDGTVLATHSGAAVSALRLLTVLRGQYGTTAATHAQNAPVTRLRVPAKIRSLAIAVTVNQVLQETSGYARTVGGPDTTQPAPGLALAQLWAEAKAAYGRGGHARMRTI
jgi:hypothetical protein